MQLHKMKRGQTLVEILVVLAIIAVLAAIIMPVFFAPGCGFSSSDRAQRQETEQRLSEAHRQIGMPDITRWTERKLARDILELRDQEITTYAYIVNLHGELIFLGEAIGFGLPYSVQYTNPMKRVRGGSSYSLPQADPNGLFMPSGLSATWIMLKGPDGKVHPVYVEPQLIVSPFPLEAVNMSRRPRQEE